MPLNVLLSSILAQFILSTAVAQKMSQCDTNQYIVSTSQDITFKSTKITRIHQASNHKASNLKKEFVFAFKESLADIHQYFPKSIVNHVEPDCVVRRPQSPTRSKILSQYSFPWYEQLFTNFKLKSNFKNEVLIALIDVGFDISSSGFQKFKRTLGNKTLAFDVADQDFNVSPDYQNQDSDHGQHVSGFITNILDQFSNSEDYIQLLPIKAFSSRRPTHMSDLLKAVYLATDQGAKVINCSWGVTKRNSLSEFKAFEYARVHGALAIVAAGNEALDGLERSSPAGLPNVLSVGSINSQNQISTFSNFGKGVDIYTYGGDGVERELELLESQSIGRELAYKKGTSMSAPIISAIMAMALSQFDFDINTLSHSLVQSASKSHSSVFYDPGKEVSLSVLNIHSFFRQLTDGPQLQTHFLKPIPKTASGIAKAFPKQSQSLAVEQKKTGCQKSNSNDAGIMIYFLLLPLLGVLIKKIKLNL